MNNIGKSSKPHFDEKGGETTSTISIYTQPKVLSDPGQIYMGGIILDDFQQLIERYSAEAGYGTNVVAELYSVEYGLQFGERMEVDSINFHLSTPYVVDLLNGKTQVWDYHLEPLFESVQRSITNSWALVNFIYVPKRDWPVFLWW